VSCVIASRDSVSARRRDSRAVALASRLRGIAVATTVACALAGAALAHPGSGIAVDRQGRIFFVDTGHGVWVIDAAGRLESHDGPAFHWMAIDPDSRFGSTRFPHLPTGDLRAVGSDPMVILASDHPVAVGADGAIYFPELGGDERLRMVRMTASGDRSTLAVLPPDDAGTSLRWLNGVAAAADGSIYYTENAAVRRIDTSGAVSTVARGAEVPECQPIPGLEPKLGPLLRGLAVAADGTVHVAASGCSALLRIDAGGGIRTVLRAEPPWSPTAVAIDGEAVYVLEYLHPPNVVDRTEWIPRVRRLRSNGEVDAVATIERVVRTP
jgi:sugar lactone lactonase YvrE